MPIPIVAGAILAGISGGVTLFQAAKDGKRAREAESEEKRLMANRPEYTRPGEVNQALGLAASRYGDPTMPGADNARAESQLAAANAGTAAGAGGDPFGAVLGAQARSEQTNRQITQQESQYRLEQEAALSGALNQSAQYTDQEFQMNEYSPWADALASALNNKRDFRDASREGLSSGMGSLSQLGLGVLGAMGGAPSAASGGAAPGSAEAIAGQFPSTTSIPGAPATGGNSWTHTIPWAQLASGIGG